MSIEEANKVLEELYAVRPEMLNDKAQRLFEAIMTIADDRDRGNDLIDKLIQEVTEQDAKIDKAVKLIENSYDFSDEDFEGGIFQNKLLKILKGE